MKLITRGVLAFTLAALAAPALAQLSAGSGGGAGQPQPRVPAPDFAPPAVPGAGGSSLATSVPVPHAESADPTTELFDAVNNGDYNAAQDAVSRGADMNAQNPLGETPLDLSIALNRDSITFMLLSARNESGGDQPTGAPWTATPAAPGYRRYHHPLQATRAGMMAAPRTAPSGGPGTPDANSGFLGFDH